MNKVMNIGFIGCGGFVQGNHLPNAHGSSNFHIRALCDVQDGILAKLDPTYRPDYVTTDFKRIAADPQIEMVVIGTTPNVRIEPIRACAENGKHMYVEKPLSLGYDDSKTILDILRKHKVKLQVGFNRPYSPIMQEAKRVFKIMRKGVTLITYRIVGEDTLWPQFHRDNVASGKSNTIIHEITHIFNLLNWLTDQDPTSVYTVGGPSDNNQITLTYPDQTYATITSGSCGTAAYPKERMEIFSDHKTLVADEFVELHCTRIADEKDRHYPLKRHPHRERTDGLSVAELRNDLMQWRDRLTEEEIKVGYYYQSYPAVDKGHAAALQFLCEAIRDGLPVQTDEYAGAVATILGLQAVESLESGKPIALDFSGLNG